MDDLLLHIATIDIVELQFRLVEAQLAHLDVVRTRKLLQLSQDDTLHADIDGLRRSIADDGGLLVEMTQLAGIIRHANLKLIIAANIVCRIVDGGAVAVGYDLRDTQLAMALILKLEDGSNGLLIARHASINSGLDGHQFLCDDRQGSQQQKGEYGLFLVHHHYFTLRVIEGAVARNSGA